VTIFVVVRHGETRWNVEMRIQGQRDSDLTENGITQAEALAQRLAGERIDALISSDLGRALDTARRIGRRIGLDVVADARFRERAFGAGEGMTYTEVDAAYPGAFARIREVDPDFAIPGGESRRQFHERVRDAFDDLARRHAGRTVVVVTHGGVLATFFRHVHGIAIHVARAIPIANAAYNVLRHDGGAWTVESWDNADHLPPGERFEEA
jgi:probable phosphoglycerate mutase